MLKNPLQYILMRFILTIFFSLPIASIASEPHIDLDEHENPFRDEVRVMPCSKLVNGFQEFCNDKFNATHNPVWKDAHDNPLKTLRGYVQENLKGKRKLLVGCIHTLRSCVSSAPIGAVPCREDENHLHKDWVTVIDNYAEYKNGKFFVFSFFPPIFNQIDKAAIINTDRIDYVETKYIQNINELNVDFIRLYPFGQGSEDFPLGYFDEIYMERARFEHGLEKIPDEKLSLLASHLRPGGKLTFDFDGRLIKIVVPSLTLWPRIANICPSSLYNALNDVYKRWWLLTNRGGSDLLEGAEELEDNSGIVTLKIAETHNYEALKTQCASWFEETWLSPNPQSYFDKYLLKAPNREFLEILWKKHALKQADRLRSHNFVEFQFKLNETNPINQRKNSRLIIAIKKK